MMLRFFITTLVVLMPNLSASIRSALPRVPLNYDHPISANSAYPERNVAQPSTSQQTILLSPSQIDSISAIRTTLRSDPMREGKEFTDFERGVGVAITQIARNSKERMLIALRAVFSSERAQAILDVIIEDV